MIKDKVVAYFIDWCIYAIPFVLIGTFLVAFLEFPEGKISTKHGAYLMTAYYLLFFAFAGGQTPGYKLRKIKVCSVNESERPSTMKLLFRLFLFNAFSASLLIGLAQVTRDPWGATGWVFLVISAVDFALPFFNKESLMLHDILTGTKVIRLSPAQECKVVEINHHAISIAKDRKESA